MEEISPETAKEVLSMLLGGGDSEGINTSLALHLVGLADEINETEVADRLLRHAKAVAEDKVEEGWADFEALKRDGKNADEFLELAMGLESEENHESLSAAIYHHASLMMLAAGDLDAASSMVSRSMRLRDEAEDIEGRVYGLAVLSAIAKQSGEFEEAVLHEEARLGLLEKMEDKEGQMEALADLAHINATTGNLNAAKDQLEKSLEIALEIDDLSGQLVSRWGLADLAEIMEDWESAMLQLSDTLHAFLNANIPAPEEVRIRIGKLTEIMNSD